jgi:hypothetical protein
MSEALRAVVAEWERKRLSPRSVAAPFFGGYAGRFGPSSPTEIAAALSAHQFTYRKRSH